MLKCSLTNIHCTVSHVFFFQTSWKDGHSKTVALEYDISCIIGKDGISFSQNMTFPTGRKMKDDLSQENTGKYGIFFKCSVKMVFSKKLRWNMIFLVLSGKMIFFPENMFSLDGKWKIIFLKEYMETWYFLYTRTGAKKATPCPSAKKKMKDDLTPQKYT